MTKNIHLTFTFDFIPLNICSYFQQGDSVDRYATYDWCKEHKGNPIVWDHSDIYYNHGFQADFDSPVHCVNSDNDSITSVHIFGSHPVGPYAFNYGEGKKFTDTGIRIRRAFELYNSTILPINKVDRIIFSSTLWDYQSLTYFHGGAKVNSSLWNKTSENFMRNVNNRLDEIMSLVPGAELGLHTTVWFKPIGGPKAVDVIARFNDMIREISRIRELFLYDFDADVWSQSQFDRSFQHIHFRDKQHPNHIHSLALAEILLGKRFSNFVYSNGQLPGATSFNIRYF